VQIERSQFDTLVENKLPDGSRILLDSKNERVFALNTTASAAWDACAASTTLTDVAEEMKRSVSDDVTEELAEQAILQLEEQNLVKTSVAPDRTRREVLAKIGAIALPVVVGLTLAEQRAYAGQARSAGPPLPPLPHPPPPPPNCGVGCKIAVGS